MRGTASQKAIRIKLLPLICIVLLALISNTIAYAVAPTSTPSPAPSPTPDTRSIMDSYDVQFFSDGTWSSLKKEMIVAHEYYRYADGILMFMPLSVFVEQREIPCIKLSEDFNYHVIALNPSVSLKYSHTIYNQEWDIILSGETPTSDWNKLDTGKYLMSINVYASDGDRYASTASLVWMVVGDYEEGEEPMASPAPAFSPVARYDPELRDRHVVGFF